MKKIKIKLPETQRIKIKPPETQRIDPKIIEQALGAEKADAPIVYGGRILRNGFEIICPDGKHRHFPYHNKGDADFDAKVLASDGKCATVCDDEINAHHGPCPGGEHTVVPALFQPPAPIGQS